MSEVFERKVAEGLAEFWSRLVNPRNRPWLAMTPSQGGQIVGVFSNSGMSLERPDFGGARSANRL